MIHKTDYFSLTILTLLTGFTVFSFFNFPTDLPNQTASVADFNSNLVAHYTFDDNTNDSAGSNNGTASGGPTYVDGKIGKAMQFDGVDDYVNMGSSPVLDNLSRMTISLWAKINSFGGGGQGYFLDKSSAQSGGWLFQTLSTGSTVRFNVDYGTTDLRVNATSNSLTSSDFGKWVHWVVVWDGTSSATNAIIYKNGVQVSSGGIDGSGLRLDDGARNLVIGNHTGANRGFDGVVDDVYIFNRILSAEEVTSLFNSTGIQVVDNSTPIEDDTTVIVETVATPSHSTMFYIRDGGTSTVCTDWVNACDMFPTTLNRGATYYISDGAYDSYVFDDKNKENQFITIKKAINGDHGTDTGWQNSYGDGIAIFNNLIFTTDYWIMDGQKRDSLNSGYTFKVINNKGSNNHVIRVNDTDSIKFKYINIEQNGTGRNERNDGLYAPRATNMTVQNSYIHDFSSNGITMGGTENVIIENTLFSRSGADGGAVHSQGIQAFGLSRNMTIRNNIFEDIGGTASIAVAWGTNRLYIYGNIFRQSPGYTGSGTSPGQIVEISEVGEIGLSNARIYNNTFVNLHKGSNSGIVIYLQASDTNYVYNNIWYNSVKATLYGMTSHNNNYFGNTNLAHGSSLSDKEISTTEDPFVDWRNSDYRLKEGSTAINAGIVMGNEDMYDPSNISRPQGSAWDIGAYEYYTGQPVTSIVNQQPTPPVQPNPPIIPPVTPPIIPPVVPPVVPRVPITPPTQPTTPPNNIITTTTNIPSSITPSRISSIFKPKSNTPRPDTTLLPTTTEDLTPIELKPINYLKIFLDLIKNYFLNIYKRIHRGLEEVVVYRNQTASVAEFNSSLVAHYTFTNGLPNDVSGNGNSGSIQGSPTTVQGKIGTAALQFDGVDDYINAGSASSLDNLSSLSFSLWAKRTGDTLQDLISKGDSSSGGHGWYLQANASAFDRPRFTARYSETSLTVNTPSGTLPLNEWVHLTVTWDGSSESDNVHIYKNGLEITGVTRVDGVGTRNSDASNTLLIAGAATNHPFQGVIDDVRIYNKVLVQGEITQIYNVETDPDGGEVITEEGSGDEEEEQEETEIVVNNPSIPSYCGGAGINCVPQEYITIQSCVDAVNPGDTCLISEGMYNGFVTKRDGTSDKFITIEGSGPSTVIKDSKVSLRHSYYKLKNLKFSGHYLEMVNNTASHNIIERNEFTLSTQGIYMKDTGTNDTTTGPSFNLIANNIFYRPVGNGMVVLLGHDNTVSNNTFREGNGYDALRVWGIDQLISNNTFDHIISGASAIPPHSNHGDIIQTFNSSNSYISRGVIFERNYITDSNAQLGNLENDPSNIVISDWTFRNNVFVRSRIQLNLTIPKVKVYNNIAYAVPAENTSGFRFSNNPTKGSADYGEVYNNIFIGNGGFYGFNTDTIGGVADYNIISTLNGSPRSVPSEGSHGINGGFSPADIFVNLTNDFRLKPGSRAINAGKDLSGKGFSNDYSGVSRPQGSSWDIGAYEYYSGQLVNQQPIPPVQPNLPITPHIIPPVTPPVIPPTVPPVTPPIAPPTQPTPTPNIINTTTNIPSYIPSIFKPKPNTPRPDTTLLPTTTEDLTPITLKPINYLQILLNLIKNYFTRVYERIERGIEIMI